MTLPTSAEGVSGSGRVGPAGVGRAHAKVIVLGEHAVVYGAPALALPVPQLTVTARARWTPDGGGAAAVSFSMAGPPVRPMAGPACEGLRLLAEQFTARFGAGGGARRGGCVEVVIDGGVPHGRGLGSSAAYARAVVMALADLHAVKVDEDEVFALVQTAENVAHGRSSGVDARAVGARGPLLFTAGRVQEVGVAGEGVFVVADSGQVGRTKDAVTLLREGFSRSPEAREQFVERATGLTGQARDALAAGRLADLGATLTSYHDLLAAAGLSTPVIDRLVGAAHEAGSLGAKITGGGLGGCMIALARPEDAPHLTRHLHHAGAVQTWAVPLKGPADHAH